LPMKITSLDEFKELARRGTFVPVVKELVADLLTPVSAFLKIAEDADYAFLLESVEGGEHVGRYSFLGKDPFLIVRSRGGKTTWENVVTSCLNCNRKKGGRLPHEAGLKLVRPPVRPRWTPFVDFSGRRFHYEEWKPFFKNLVDFTYWNLELEE